MKKSILFLFILILCSCSFGGFKPPPPYYHWNFPDSYKYFTDSQGIWDFFTKRENDMRACGMDPVVGESDNIKVNLCLENKGWYLEEGPICEEKYYWNDPLCIKWRTKHSKPDVQPWEK